MLNNKTRLYCLQANIWALKLLTTICHSNGCNVSFITLSNHLLLPSSHSFVFLLTKDWQSLISANQLRDHLSQKGVLTSPGKILKIKIGFLYCGHWSRRGFQALLLSEGLGESRILLFFIDKSYWQIVLNLMCGGAFHVTVEQVRFYREAATSFLHTVLWLQIRKLVISPFALLLLSFSSSVASLFGTFGAELGGVWGALIATNFITDLPTLCSSCNRCSLEEERQDNGGKQVG